MSYVSLAAECPLRRGVCLLPFVVANWPGQLASHLGQLRGGGGAAARQVQEELEPFCWRERK